MSLPVTIIGMGMSSADLTEVQRDRIAKADILVGGERHLEAFPHFKGQTRRIDRHLKTLAEDLRRRGPDAQVVVLASGDPLFYGIGSYLIRALGRDNVVVVPNVSSVATAFARIKVDWQDARVLSLHGRELTATMLADLGRHPKWALFTDPQHSPAWLAKQLVAAGLDHFDFWILCRMGSPEEEVICLDLAAATTHEATAPNLVVLLKREEKVLNSAPPTAWHLGLPEAAFDHEAGLITKSEVRAVTLAKLELTGDADLTIWDLGAGSGSVAVEAARMQPRGQVLAVEQKAERVTQILSNQERFGCANLRVIEAQLPAGLEPLPPPDRIFIGGGGRRLKAIVQATCGRIKPGGILVINTVLLGSLALARKTLDELGWAHETIQIQVSRSGSMPWDERLVPQTPVWIIKAKKECK